MSFDLYASANVPPGTYTGRLVASRITRSLKTKNVGVTLYWHLESPSGGGGGRVWRTLWLSPAAIARSRGELARLGVRTLAELDRDPPVPAGVMCEVVVGATRGRDGYEETQVIRWRVLIGVSTLKGENQQ